MPPKRQGDTKKRQEARDTADGDEDINEYACAPSGMKWFFRKRGMQSDATINGHAAQLMYEDGIKARFFVSMPTWSDVHKIMIQPVHLKMKPRVYVSAS
jgi:hypothetical protein